MDYSHRCALADRILDRFYGGDTTVSAHAVVDAYFTTVMAEHQWQEYHNGHGFYADLQASEDGLYIDFTCTAYADLSGLSVTNVTVSIDLYRLRYVGRIAGDAAVVASLYAVARRSAYVAEAVEADCREADYHGVL
jgi:hypothetical protein